MVECKMGERRGADGEQDIGAQPCGALPVLAFGADQGAENERRRQADQRVEKIGGLEGGEESHVACLGERGDGPITTPSGRPRARGRSCFYRTRKQYLIQSLMEIGN